MLGLHSNVSIESFFNEHFHEHLSTISEVSKSDNGSFFIDSDVPAWNFDKITGCCFPKNSPFSTDCVLFSQKNIYFVEFKSGLDKIIDWSNFNSDGVRCAVLGDRPCPRYGIALRQRDDYKEGMLLLNFQMKASDSYKTFEKKIISQMNQPAESLCKYRLHLMAVVDCENFENSYCENIMLQMSESEAVPEMNHIAKIQNALKRFNRSDIWFDQVDVYGVQDFCDFLKETFS